VRFSADRRAGAVAAFRGAGAGTWCLTISQRSCETIAVYATRTRLRDLAVATPWLTASCRRLVVVAAGLLQLAGDLQRLAAFSRSFSSLFIFA